MTNVAIEFIDSMVKEYLIFRGFSTSLKTFEQQVKNDKNRSFKVERVLEQFSSHIQMYDVVELKKYWSYFDKNFFSKLGHQTYKVIKKLETRVLRLYLIHAIQNNKPDKVSEFFEKYVNELQHEESWKDWFVLPFMKNPEQNKVFSIYFTKIWQDSVMLSLANCLDTVFSHITLPKLLDFEKENKKLKQLMEENDRLKEQIMELSKQLNQSKQHSTADIGIQSNEKEIVEMDIELTKTPKRTSSRGRFGWKILGSKDKESKVSQKESTNTSKILTRRSMDENIFRASSFLQGDQNSSAIESKADIVTGEEDLERIHFQSDHYTLLDDSDNTDSSKEKESDHVDSKSLNDSEEKSGLYCVDEQSDAPFIVLCQDEFTEHTSPIVSCRFSESNNLVASLDTNGIFKVWQYYPTVSQSSLFSVKADATSLDWIPKLEDKLLIGKSNGSLSVHDINTRKILWESFVHQKYKRIACISCSPLSPSAVCSAVTSISETKKNTPPITRFANQQKMIKMKQYSAYNGAKQGIISEWDLSTGQMKSELFVDPYPVCIHSMAYNHNGTLLVTGGADGMVRLFDIRNSDCLIGWHAHSTDILDVVFNPDETSIYSIGADGKVCIWDINKVTSKIAEFPLQIGCTGIHHYWMSGDVVSDDIPCSKLLVCDSDGRYMMTCGPSGLMLYKITPRTIMDESMHILCPSSEVLTLDWTSSSNFSTVMCGTRKGTIQISRLSKKL